MKPNKIYSWDNLPVILDCKTVAIIYGVTPETIKNMIYSGKLIGRKAGRKWVFDKEYIRSLTDVSNERSGS